MDEKKLRGKLATTSESLKKVLEELKKFLKVPKKNTAEQKATRELEATVAKVKATEANAVHAIAIGACYDLFRQLLADDHQVQWDRIAREAHCNDPWTALDGSKHKGLHMKTSELLEDCIMFHKLRVFLCDAAEPQKFYMMGSLKKPHGMSIKKHVSCFETMNVYISLLPTLQDSALVVASTEKGNIPFNDATLAGILLATCHTNWRNLYELNHKTIPESTRSMLHDHKNIEKVFVEKNNKKPETTRSRLAQPPRKELVCPGSTGMEAVLEDQPPRSHASPSTASYARQMVGPSIPMTPASVVDSTRMAKS